MDRLGPALRPLRCLLVETVGHGVDVSDRRMVTHQLHVGVLSNRGMAISLSFRA
ncbi:MAG TPA: hypothetical protein VGB14_06850 [Acidimicrobiales bacterium]|jgi:hypothetical protein